MTSATAFGGHPKMDRVPLPRPAATWPPASFRELRREYGHDNKGRTNRGQGVRPFPQPLGWLRVPQHLPGSRFCSAALIESRGHPDSATGTSAETLSATSRDRALECEPAKRSRSSTGFVLVPPRGIISFCMPETNILLV